MEDDDTMNNHLEQLKTCNVSEAQTILKHHLSAIWGDPELSGKLPPMMIWGPPGIGKSTLVRGVTEELDIGFVDVRLAQREPVDIRGLPVPREDRQGIDWIVSSEWPRVGVEGTPERGIILFDELTAADSTLQVAAYEFILDRRLGELYKVPDGWYIVAAGNRAEDNAVARTMSSALANRFLHLDLSAGSDDWCNWAMSTGHHPDVVGFIRFRPDLLLDMSAHHERGWPSPRSWSRVSDEVRLAEKSGLSDRFLCLIIDGLIGIGAGMEFKAFRDSKSLLPDVRAMLNGTVKAQFPEKLDQQWAMITSLAPILVEEEEPEQFFDGLFNIFKVLQPSWAELAWHDIMTMSEKKNNIWKDFCDHPRYKEIADKVLGAALVGVEA
ncbi:MAG: AAA family ATPase [Euryarchaeota archaeon]|nr:AAA family ATPase [Euryarchaeota archaeon]